MECDSMSTKTWLFWLWEYHREILCMLLLTAFFACLSYGRLIQFRGDSRACCCVAMTTFYKHSSHCIVNPFFSLSLSWVLLREQTGRGWSQFPFTILYSWRWRYTWRRNEMSFVLWSPWSPSPFTLILTSFYRYSYFNNLSTVLENAVDNFEVRQHSLDSFIRIVVRIVVVRGWCSKHDKELSEEIRTYFLGMMPHNGLPS